MPAKLIMVLRAADGAPVLCAVVEVQLARDERKRWSWLLFVGPQPLPVSVRARHRK